MSVVPLQEGDDDDDVGAEEDDEKEEDDEDDHDADGKKRWKRQGASSGPVAEGCRSPSGFVVLVRRGEALMSRWRTQTQSATISVTPR